MPTKVLSMDTPYTQLFGTKPNYSKLKIFGCLCYPWLRPYTSHKLEPRSTPCVFLGYFLTQSAYFCLDPSTSRVFVSRHVTFVENKFPFVSLSTNVSSSPAVEELAWVPTVEPLRQQQVLVEEPSPETGPASTTSTPTTTEPAPQTEPATSTAAPTAATSQPTQHAMTTRSQNNIVKPNPKYGLTTALAPYVEPQIITQAMADDRWRKSATAAFNAQVANNTWDLVPAEEVTNPVGNIWIFRYKYNPDGTEKSLKSRLVAKGYHQRPGIDYHETFSPVIKSPTIRLLLGLAAKYDWPLKQLDINNAFLRGTLNEVVYMVQPSGFRQR